MAVKSERWLFSTLPVLLSMILLPNLGVSQDPPWAPTEGADDCTLSVPAYDTSGNIYLGTRAGLFRSSDYGTHWEHTAVCESDAYIGVEDIAISPDNVLYAVTAGNGPRVGYFRSSDGGKSWNGLIFIDKISTQPYRHQPEISASIPGSGRILFVKGAIILLTAEDRLWRSTDNGINWNSLGPYDPQRQFSILCAYTNSSLFAGTANGVLHSRDGGMTWALSGLTGVSIIILFATTHGTLFAGNEYAFYTSTDSGMTWNPYSSNPFGTALFYLQPLDDGSLMASSARRDTARPLSFDGGETSFAQSYDDGKTWILRASLNEYIVLLSQHPSGKLFAANFQTGRMFRSDDTLKTWREIPEPNRTITRIISITDNLLAYTNGSEINYSEDQGKSWYFILWGEVWKSIQTIAAAGDGVSFYSGMKINDFDSTGGVLLEGMQQEINMGLHGKSIASLYAANDGTLLAGVYGAGIFQWQADTIWNLRYGAGQTFLAFASDGVNIYAGGEFEGGGILLASSDKGRTWSNILSTQHSITSLLISQQGTILAGTMSGYVFRSRSAAISWDSLKIADSVVVTVAGNRRGWIVAGTSGQGIFRSTDDGASWVEFNNGLTTSNINILIADSSDNFLAGTADERILKLIVPKPTDVKEILRIPDRFALSQNYPNPFNPNTNIGYRTSDGGFVTLKIFNVLGQEVATLVNEVKPPGEYHVRWDAANMPSGVYFYEMQAGAFHDVKKFILTK